MLRYKIIVLSLLFCGGMLGWSLTSATKEKPALVATPSQFEMGAIEYAKTLKYDFSLFNTSSSGIRILKVQSDCGCTTVNDISGTDIASKKDVKLSVSYHTPSEGVGAILRTLVVTYQTGGGKEETSILQLRGNLMPLVSLTTLPSNIVFIAGDQSHRLLLRGSSSALDALPNEIKIGPDEVISLNVDMAPISADKMIFKVVNINCGLVRSDSKSKIIFEDKSTNKTLVVPVIWKGESQ